MNKLILNRIEKYDKSFLTALVALLGEYDLSGADVRVVRALDGVHYTMNIGNYQIDCSRALTRSNWRCGINTGGQWGASKPAEQYDVLVFETGTGTPLPVAPVFVASTVIGDANYTVGGVYGNTPVKPVRDHNEHLGAAARGLFRLMRATEKRQGTMHTSGAQNTQTVLTAANGTLDERRMRVLSGIRLALTR